MSEHFKQTIVFDFDGVIHDYKTGWKGAEVIDGELVPGIRELVSKLYGEYKLCIQSSRCIEVGGKEAIEKWLHENKILVYFDVITHEKLPAIVYLDDRAICFTGTTYGLYERITNFKPWNRS